MSRDFTLLDVAGITFRDPALLELSLTHASRQGEKNNQRLEFLGDRVLSLVLAEAIYMAYPEESEGALALRHGSLVQASTLAAIARAHGVSGAIRAALVGIKTPNDIVDNIIADTLEAIIGALYLDQGYPSCQKLITTLWADVLRQMVVPPQDPKNALQEWAQARGKPLPMYRLCTKKGPDHALIFDIQVSVDKNLKARGKGPSRRAAEKDAARALLELLSTQK